RRRHTILVSDWSSDVCSSDLITVEQRGFTRDLRFNRAIQTRMRVDEPAGEGLYYTAAMHITPLVRPEMRRVLVIGLGGAALPKQDRKSVGEGQGGERVGEHKG